MTTILNNGVLFDFVSNLGTIRQKLQKHQKAYSVLPRAQVFRWFKAFSEGRELIEDELRSGRLSIAKIMKTLLEFGTLSNPIVV